MTNFICDNCKKNFESTVINGEEYAVNGMHFGKQEEVKSPCYCDYIYHPQGC